MAGRHCFIGCGADADFFRRRAANGSKTPPGEAPTAGMERCPWQRRRSCHVFRKPEMRKGARLHQAREAGNRAADSDRRERAGKPNEFVDEMAFHKKQPSLV